jgi:hypothetical protein
LPKREKNRLLYGNENFCVYMKGETIMLRHKMTIVGKAIVGGSNSGSILKEVIHRNSKMNREEIDRKMHWLGSYGGPDGMRSNWEAEVDMVDFAGMVRDFELLKLVGAIGSVKVKQRDRDIV